MALAISEYVSKLITTRDLGAFWNISISEVVNTARGGAFTWTLFMNTVTSTPF